MCQLNGAAVDTYRYGAWRILERRNDVPYTVDFLFTGIDRMTQDSGSSHLTKGSIIGGSALRGTAGPVPKSALDPR
jgi:hypothetical protein